ncbi:MAG: DEAD/DEAH box helicase [Chromatiaceae bacterium]|nr:DEAD/DEAH box helicase [Chromatiaceae bacterium]MBP6733947.1 DEAD/DEAH box helicase [Chromatiaceae bacterium]MBP6806978.1 DEAD/DEAH box helicase [Chromatiaceae bacterium]MBP8282377.1 DEAD/DEAH box helicase [Chromatiaceae bacterium]MBP8288565.1 DEAD/DEAH box helicase [Chromatiaceae bacterium]
MFDADQQVQHPRFGTGAVILDQGQTVIVRFDHGIESCEAATLTRRLALAEAVRLGHWSPALDVTLKAQAAAIRSLNDAWGVFSRSRIDLLPHQLWVCHRALQRWPMRLLIADDVGLGKTIEAGLILWPLLSSGKVRRLLILTPASLVEQWQYRLRTLFDIRLSMYRPEVDTPRADFWSTHNQVVASLPTLRSDRKGRHDRLLEAPPWDLLIVDEAHHLNADEQTGKTLGYRFVERLMREDRAESCLFFTGTPHRGKPFGFWSLMSLLRPDDFGPHRPEREQLPLLRQCLIRNFKQKVTDMAGKRLFQPVVNHPETYGYSEAEADFYRLLTRFIMAGNAYASRLDQSGRRQVTLVLIAIQKIASSSVAAIRAALRKRLGRIKAEVEAFRRQQGNVDRPEDEEDQDPFDALERWAEQERFHLMEDELPHLQALLDAAEAIGEESKILRIGEIIDTQYLDRFVLLFTEYKATQALVVATLMARFGEDSVGFINGDDRLPGVCLPSGKEAVLNGNRETTADAFNQGRIRFLVSTEAGGEGIDLQARCHTLIHVDLPWNPMRLHQRVGRLNRYGQTRPVEVVTVRNPHTVESRIWGKLEQKLSHIMAALGHAMDEPEDLMQMVLGMAGPGFFNELFVEGQGMRADRLDDWFDAKTGNLGGRSAISTVLGLVGHCQSFDLSQLDDVPRKDLPDLIPFFHGMLVRHRRRPERDDGVFSFKTPDEWLTSPGIRTRYEGLIFHRNPRDNEEAKRIVGVGHQLFDRALAQAGEWEGALALVKDLARPLAVFRFQDLVTGQTGRVRQVIAGVTSRSADEMVLVRDEDVLAILNQRKLGASDSARESLVPPAAALASWLNDARKHAIATLDTLKLPFLKPLVDDLALFWPEKAE